MYPSQCRCHARIVMHIPPLKLGYDKPDMYLGAKLCKTRLHNGVWAWAISLVKYVQEAVRNGTVHLAANYGGRFSLPKKEENPFKMGYDSELDTSSDKTQMQHFIT